MLDEARAIAAGLFVCAHLALAAYVLQRAWMLASGLRRAGPAASPPPPRMWPVVTVQLPVHDERYVIERLIDAACALEYPRDRLQVQVLDDSTDDTTALAEARAAFHRARGVDVRVHHRCARSGFKAGALAAGLAAARGELIAVFDADFAPAPDFLSRVVPYFSDPSIGMVQARWAHANRELSGLTRGQAVTLDGHFRLEQRARAAAGRFFNFNGTAGAWRRACIAAAGGWSADTLTEDLDLSYRAQLAGWRFRYLDDVEAAGELPVDIDSLKRQQRRWAKGSIQTARKLLPAVWASRWPLAVKLEATFHLTSNLTYVLVMTIAALLPVVLTMPPAPGETRLAWQIGSLAITAAAWCFFAVAARAEARSWWGALREAPQALVLAMGLTWSQARAVCEGLAGRSGPWERTPKFGRGVHGRAWRGSRYARAAGGWGECAIALACAAVAVMAVTRGEPTAAVFPVLLAAGTGWVGWLAARDRAAVGQARAGHAERPLT